MRHLFLALLLTAAALADPCVKEVTLQPQATGGAVLQGRVVLASPAVGDNVWVELRAGDSVHVPMALRVPAGESAATFAVSTDPVAQDQVIEVKATVRGVGPACAVKLVPEVTAVR